MNPHDVDLDRERRRYAKPPKPVGRRELRAYLDGCSKEELVSQLLRLFDDHPPVRDHFQALLRPQDDETTTRAKVKRLIENEFFPARGEPKMRMSVVRKAIRDYARLAPSDEALADVRLFAAETALSFAKTYGIDDGRFYPSLGSLTRAAFADVAKHCLEGRFRARCLKLLRDSDHIGWGFEDEVADHFAWYIGDPDDEDDL